MKKFTLIAGPCAIEDDQRGFEIAENVKSICDDLNIDYIFKASYRKANRSKNSSFTGIGDQKALEIIKQIGQEFNLPTITDVHESNEPKEVADYVTHLQIPAFLCRQTDLISAACKTQLPLNIKKGQFLSPYQMKNIIEKCNSFGNDNIILCERGSSFGYDNLIVDFLGISEQKAFNYPIILDVTHSLQLPGGQGNSAGGRSHQAEDLARAAIALKISGLFIEVHPNPDKALCDGPSATKLEDFEDMITKIKKIDDLVKSEKF